MSATETITRTEALPVVTPTIASSLPHGDVNVKLNFFKGPEDGSAPFQYVEKQPEGQQQRNYGFSEHEVKISDLRGKEAQFELDKHGFIVAQSHAGGSPGVDFWDDESVKTKYYPEVEKVLRDNIPHVHKVVIFDHTVRKAEPAAKRGPVLAAHIDQTAKAAAERVRLHIDDPERAEQLLKGRYRLVNVWRPINGPVESFPLAVADSQSFPDSSLHPVQHRYPHRTGETAGISHNPSTRWHYLSGMRNEERLFLQCFDSLTRTRTPHTAFVHPDSTEQSKPRESIEVRTLVFCDE